MYIKSTLKPFIVTLISAILVCVSAYFLDDAHYKLERIYVITEYHWTYGLCFILNVVASIYLLVIGVYQLAKKQIGSGIKTIVSWSLLSIVTVATLLLIAVGSLCY